MYFLSAMAFFGIFITSMGLPITEDASFRGDKTSCQTDERANGCTIPYLFSYIFWFEDVLKPDCDRHDICYSCGSAFGMTKHICDVNFDEDMKQRCDNEVSWFYWSLCRLEAKRYYQSVVVLGDAYYGSNLTTPKWCYPFGDLQLTGNPPEHWVRACLKV